MMVTSSATEPVPKALGFEASGLGFGVNIYVLIQIVVLRLVLV